MMVTSIQAKRFLPRRGIKFSGMIRKACVKIKLCQSVEEISKCFLETPLTVILSEEEIFGFEMTEKVAQVSWRKSIPFP